MDAVSFHPLPGVGDSCRTANELYFVMFSFLYNRFSFSFSEFESCVKV